MIHVAKNFNSPPSELIDSKWDNLKSALLIEGGNHEVKSACYRDTTIDGLIESYNNKCAICERNRGTELQVDHYRPKKPRLRGDHRYRQSGYFWLAYTWANLIPLCSKCNQKKSNKFPLKYWPDDDRVATYLNSDGMLNLDAYSPVWLHEREAPLLINPEIDEKPGKHFEYDSKGKIIGRTPEGIETINVCALNRRDLRRERKAIIIGYVSEIKEAIVEYKSSQELGKKAELRGALKGVYRRICKGLNFDQPFSHLHGNIFNYFDKIIASHLCGAFRKKVCKSFEQYCNKNGLG